MLYRPLYWLQVLLGALKLGSLVACMFTCFMSVSKKFFKKQDTCGVGPLRLSYALNIMTLLTSSAKALVAPALWQ